MSYITDLIAKKRAAVVDWKEHPLEVMTHLDRLAGRAWRKDVARWELTESLDLDRLRAAEFWSTRPGRSRRRGA